MPAHKNDTKEFSELTFAEQASSVNAMLMNVQAAIEHHVKHSQQKSETAEKCIGQVERMLDRIRLPFDDLTAASGIGALC